MNQAGWMGDTLWVSDGRLNRVTFISPDLSVVRTTPLPAGARPQPADIGRYPEFSRISPSAIHSDGTLGASLVIPGGPLAEQWDDQWTWHFRITAEGRIVHAIGREPDSGHPDYSYYHSFSNGSVRGWPFPFVYRPRFFARPGRSFALDGRSQPFPLCPRCRSTAGTGGQPTMEGGAMAISRV